MKREMVLLPALIGGLLTMTATPSPATASAPIAPKW